MSGLIDMIAGWSILIIFIAIPLGIILIFIENDMKLKNSNDWFKNDPYLKDIFKDIFPD